MDLVVGDFAELPETDDLTKLWPCRGSLTMAIAFRR